jgi:AcrR family transcriptional regulator
VAEAGVSKGTFFHHFADRSTYLLALHRRFHDRLLLEMLAAVDGLPPGRERLLAASLTYLDGCLRDRGVRALLLEARAEPAVAAQVQHRNADHARRCQDDFAALGRPHPLQSGQLWVGLTAEAALLELAAGRRQPAVREALAAFLDAPAAGEQAP